MTHLSMGLATAWAVLAAPLGTAADAQRAPAAPIQRADLDPQKRISQYVHDLWQDEHGLPMNAVMALAQSPDGFLWVGTQAGLARFDGATFQTYSPRTNPGLGSPDITSIAVDAKGMVWVGTSGPGGLSRFDGRTFTRFTKGLPHPNVLALRVDRRGRVWAGTSGAIVRLDADSFVTLRGPKVGAGSIVELGDGTLLFGSSSGVLSLQGDTVGYWRSPRGEMRAPVPFMTSDGAGGVWIAGATLTHATGAGSEEWTTKDGLPDNLRSLATDRLGNLWIGTEGGGLYRKIGSRFERFSTADGLSDNVVPSLLADREGGLWVGTFGGGLNRLRNAPFTGYTERDGLSESHLWSVFGDRKGRLWVGTHTGGLDLFENGRITVFTEQHGLPHNTVFSTTETRDGEILAGTQNGIASFRDGRWHRWPHPRNGILAMYETRDRTVWIGTLGGGLFARRNGVVERIQPPTITAESFWAFIEDREGTLWIGTREQGLLRYRNGEFTAFRTKHGLISEFVTSLYADEHGLWIGSSNGGLHLMRNGRIQALPIAAAVPFNDISSIVEDDLGHLWLGSSQGIASIAKADLLALANGAQKTIRARRYDRLDGLPTREFSFAGQNAAWKDQRGRLWYPTVKGLVVVDPRNMPTNTAKPTVLVERVVADGRAIDATDGIELPAGASALEIHYTAPILHIPERARFRYRLSGYDAEWIDAGNRRVAYYTRLPGGHYRFEVEATNDAGVRGIAPASLSFGIRPRFRETPWFAALAVVVVLAAGVALHRVRLHAMAARGRRLTAEVQARTRELQAARDDLEIRVRERTMALLLSEQRYRELYDDTPSMYFTVDADGTVLSVNQFGADYLGYGVRDLVGQSVLRVFYEDDKAAATARVRECIAEPGRVFHWELRKVRRDGGMIWVKETARAMTDRNGRPVVLIVCEDITERKRVEQQLQQAQKLESIGRLAGGVAHDFNNLLTVISGFTQIVRNDMDASDPRRVSLGEVQSASERAAALTRQLLAFARRQVVEPRVLDLNHLVLELDRMLRRLIGEDIELVTVPHPELWPVLADPAHVEQVVINLVVNARDAMPKGGMLSIETANATLDASYVARYTDVSPGEYVMLVVSDTGDGMSDEVKAHLFEPFFTTKVLGQGTGLGLATCYGIARQSGGHITVYSEAGIGTTFRVYLPRAARTALSSREKHDPSPLPGGNETVLVVEDEPQVREVAVQMLRGYGYNVLAAATGDEALSIAEEHGGAIDVLLTDVVMPKMNGKELADRLRAARPGLKVVFMSGHASAVMNSQGMLEPGAVLVQKPFTVATLTRRLRSVLDAGDPSLR